MSLIGLFSLSLFSGFAQAPASSTDRHIVLDMVVTDKSGKPVAGLQQQDFTLLDNKQPRKIDYLRPSKEARLRPIPGRDCFARR
jgi:hypothetical protein